MLSPTTHTSTSSRTTRARVKPRASALRVERASLPNSREKIPRIILHAINSELRGVDFFTREDLLQLRVLQSVATVTRYRMVCESVRWLLDHTYIRQLSRTEFSLPTRGRGAFGPTLVTQYTSTVKRLISAQHRKPFDLVDLLTQWTTDPQLTTNAKRVVLRQTLKGLRRTGELQPTNQFMVFQSRAKVQG